MNRNASQRRPTKNLFTFIGTRGCFFLLGVATVTVGTLHCNTGLSGSSHRNDLTQMKTEQVTINGNVFQVWLALTETQRELGLMQVTESELADLPADSAAGWSNGAYRGMLFVFAEEQPLAFWMYNTITPLDIAYIRSDGEIIQIATMAPLETRTYPSVLPAQYALEVRAGLFEQLQIKVGDRVEFPDSFLKAKR